MSLFRPFSHKVTNWRRLHKVVTISLLAALLTGLIPPPLLRTILPTPAAALVEAAASLVASTSAATALAAPLAQAVTGSNVLTITKTVVGSANPGPFNVTVTGPGGYNNNPAVSVGTPTVLTGLASGIYTVTETSPGAGWTTVYTATASAGSATGGSSHAVVTLQNANPATLAVTPITGKVFRDFNSDGQITANGVVTDTGVAGVTVTAYDKNGNTVGNATSAANGTYTINPSAAGPYRVEFTTLPAGYEPTTHGTGNGTSTQFVTVVSASNINLGIAQPCDYC